ncbi:hypothetical protein [Hymenobacter nivis]|uniref:Tetratricopeptide repeat protein n=1 Tax=Hymenobacter nivis TaxID=1850093 RepID=A0A502GNN6_9BACT|nr:hypothetical protein [Hymenobacter nivis]TPG63769.1 hypothetical protein EAH73_17145 [Hymenobacter nivis]
MTRAALLHVLDHPTAIAPAEVRELEQLAQAFPYCQTAHLLLAKAAHDQGTMLASQRLRRAATYATDRELLRRLIEQVAPAEAASAAPEIPSAEAVPAAIGAPSAVPEITPAEAAPAEPIAPVEAPAAGPVPAPAEPEDVAEATPVAAVSAPAAAPTPETSAPEASAPETSAAEGSAATQEQAAEALALPLAEPMLEAAAAEAVAGALAPEVAPAAEVPAETAPAEEVSVGAPASEAAPAEAAPTEVIVADGPLAAGQEILTPAAEKESVAQAEPAAEPAQAATDLPAAPAPEPLPDEPAGAPEEPELPAVAPPIHPPEAASAARVEFDLLEAPVLVAPVYELPGLVDEWAAAASTLALAPAPAALLPAEPRARPLTAADFTGDAALGYGLDGGSRLGFAVQLRNSWDADDQAAAAAQGPAAALPPTGEFFAPDALLLDHWTAHRPPDAPSSIDLINTFLRRQPRLTRPAMLPPSSGAQVDLSVRNTRPETELASEGLAQILARQGKTARAIEIYERLMVKQPEKMAYFAAQIHQLQPPAR